MLSRNYVFHVGRKNFFKIQSISLVVLPLCPVPVMKINVSSEGDGVGARWDLTKFGRKYAAETLSLLSMRLQLPSKLTPTTCEIFQHSTHVIKRHRQSETRNRNISKQKRLFIPSISSNPLYFINISYMISRLFSKLLMSSDSLFYELSY